MAKGDYLSSNSWISFPFKQDQDIPEEIRRLFVDAEVSATTHNVSLTAVVYSISTGILQFVVGGNSYSTSVSANGVYQVVRGYGSSFVIDMSYLNTLDNYSFSGNIELESSCIDVDSTCIESIELFYGDGSPLNKVVKGDVILEVGYNTELEDGEDDENTITLSASPGSGLGIYPCPEDCKSEDIDTDGHSLVTDNGNAVITGDGCYEVTAKNGIIQIHGKCVACCQCQDFVDIVLELKKIAGKLADTNKEITGKKTNLYFDYIDRFALDFNNPALDIQIDITPSAAIAALSMREDPPTGFDDMEPFRVTCMITNMCGLPCFLCTPDKWDIQTVFHVFPTYVRLHSNPHGPDTMSPDEQLNFGIDAGISGPGGILLNGYCVDTTIDIYDTRKNAMGYLTSSSCRGPARRVKRKDGTEETRYDYIDPRLPYYTNEQLQVEETIDKLKDLALRDLNTGVNPSYTITDSIGITDALIPNLPDKGWPGFLMPAGYTLTITNTYLISVPEQIKHKKYKLFSHFYGDIYCPLVAYSFAYNSARPTRGDWEEVDDGYKVTWTWKETDLFSSKINPSRIRRPVYAFKVYDIDSGEYDIRL